MQNSIAMFIFSAFYWNYPFWQNLVQLIKIVRLSSNLVPTISHINYWKNCWKNFCKFWNGPHCKNKSGPFPPLIVAVYWQSSNTKACVKKPSQILANNIDDGGRWIALIVYVRYCLKEYMKNKKGFGKPWHFSNHIFISFYYSWCLGYVKWFYDWLGYSWITLTLKKTEVSKLWGDKMDFIIKSEYSKYPFCSFFLTCYTARAPISFMNFFCGMHY